MTRAEPETGNDHSDMHTAMEAEGARPAANQSSSTSLHRSIMRIPVTLKVVVGSVTLPVSTLAALHPGSIIKLDRGVGDKVDVIANGRVIARGEIVVLDDAGSRYGVAIDELVTEPLSR